MTKLVANYLWLIPVAVFSILLVLGALAHPLWGDEAETALFARNINQSGIPTGWDGVNLIGLWDANALNGNLITHSNPWLQFYLVAVSFKLFGESSFSARLPFILISIISMPIFYYLFLKLTESRRVALLAIWLYSLCVPIILFAYQARYYALNTALGIGMFYLSFKGKWSLKDKIAFLLISIIFIYNHYLSFFIFYSSLFCSGLIAAALTKQSKGFLKGFFINYLGLGFLVLASFLPWMVYIKPFESKAEFFFTNFWEFLTYYLPKSVFLVVEPLNLSQILPVFFIFPVTGYLLFKEGLKSKLLLLLSLTIVVYLFVSALLTAILDTKAPLSAIRYNTVLFPLVVLLMAYLLERVFRGKRLIFGLVIIFYTFSNIFSLTAPKSYLFEYLKEVTNPYPTPDKLVADFLKKNAKDGQTAFVSLDRDHDPLIFHLDKKLKFVNRVTPTNPRLFPKNFSTLPQYIYSFKGRPDWVILYNKRGRLGSVLTFDFRELPIGVDLKNDYQEFVIPVFFSDTSRPEIGNHSFSGIDPGYIDQVFIFRKKKSQ